MAQTSAAVSGCDIRVDFVISARAGLTEAQLVEALLSGSLFAVKTGTTGKPGQSFGTVMRDR